MGAYAEYIVIRADRVAKVDPAVDPAEAAALSLNYLTAYQMLKRLADVAPGMNILIHGGAGGVGTALLDLLKDRGVDLFATASTPKHDLIRSYGAKPIDYKSEVFENQLQSAGGADIVFDPIGGAHIARARVASKKGGNIICYGFMSAVSDAKRAFWQTWIEWVKLKIDPRYSGSFYAILSPPFSQAKHIQDDLTALCTLLAEDKIRPSVGAEYPLENTSQAHQALENAEHAGKIILRVS